MARIIRPHSISSTVTEEEKSVLDKLDDIIDESKAEFIRRVTIREARKLLKKGK